jgi:putative membrane protein
VNAVVSSLFAFLHHIAAFTLVAAIAVEFVLLRDEVGHASVRRLRRADMIYGISAGVIVVVGFLRVFYFEKGASYYFHSVPFVLKLSLFVLIALLSIYPTIKFAAWGRALKAQRYPLAEPADVRRVRRLLHWEMIALVPLILCAALMARGVGHWD